MMFLPPPQRRYSRRTCAIGFTEYRNGDGSSSLRVPGFVRGIVSNGVYGYSSREINGENKDNMVLYNVVSPLIRLLLKNR